ncbi:MAG: AbrB/MazE/SpoVT family DNA-binding domain-containing protein [Clostridia bacterium]|nr:AbrB/MazE/SpoVT family DNA-binding domain-containing protein [Clostridia bacterium]
MLAELRQKSQVTIPKALINKLGLSQGDQFEIYEKNGVICLVPVIVYPKQYIDELLNEVSEIKAKVAAGEQPVFDSVDAMFDALETE